MYNAPYQGVANQLSQYGRFGDSQLVHLNPAEVQMLARMSPTGTLTRNPMTGQPEAFLPMLAPLLGGFLGKALLGTTLTGILGTTAGTAAAGALGSAAATTAMTGDLEQGIMSGITGFGLGTALGSLGGAATDVANPELLSGLGDAASASQSALDATSGMGNAAFLPDTSNLGSLADMGSQTALSPSFLQAAQTASPLGQAAAGTGMLSRQAELMNPALSAPPVAPTEPGLLQQSGQFLNALTQPSAFLPMYVGETGRQARAMEMQAEEEGTANAARMKEESEKRRRRTLGQMSDVFNQIRQDYPVVGYANGGRVGYAEGGNIGTIAYNMPSLQAFRESAGLPDYNLPNADEVQASLRGPVAVAPPQADYSAVYLGGQGYLPGVAPEFQYFRQATETPAAPASSNIPPPGPLQGGGSPTTDQNDIFTGPGIYVGPDSRVNIGSPYDIYLGREKFNPTEDTIVGSEIFRVGPYNPYENVDDLYASIYGDGTIQTTEQATPIAPRESLAPAAGSNEVYGGDSMVSPPLESSPNYSGFYDYNYLMPFAEGGVTPEMGAPAGDAETIVPLVVAAIRGEVENADQIISMFVQMYGPDAFLELRDQVLNDIVPGAQTEGMVQGAGGGQDDMVAGMIGSQQPVAVSPGEYIVPADVVAAAGGGYSGAGADFFDGLMDDIRKQTMGTTQQMRPYQA